MGDVDGEDDRVDPGAADRELLAADVQPRVDDERSVETGSRRLYTGHVRTLAGGQPTGSVAVVTSVQAVPSQLVGNSNARNRDISNVIVPGATLGGRAYRVVVACSDPLAGDMELEFTFKYGL